MIENNNWIVSLIAPTGVVYSSKPIDFNSAKDEFAKVDELLNKLCSGRQEVNSYWATYKLPDSPRDIELIMCVNFEYRTSEDFEELPTENVTCCDCGHTEAVRGGNEAAVNAGLFAWSDDEIVCGECKFQRDAYHGE